MNVSRPDRAVGAVRTTNPSKPRSSRRETAAKAMARSRAPSAREAADQSSNISAAGMRAAAFPVSALAGSAAPRPRP